MTVSGCTGRCRKGPGQSAITVHGREREGAGDPQRDNGARGRCLGARDGAGRDRGRVHGDGARVHGKVQEGDRGRAR